MTQTRNILRELRVPCGGRGFGETRESARAGSCPDKRITAEIAESAEKGK